MAQTACDVRACVCSAWGGRENEKKKKIKYIKIGVPLQYIYLYILYKLGVTLVPGT